MHIRNWSFRVAILLAGITVGALGIQSINPVMALAQTTGGPTQEGFEFSTRTSGLRYHFPRKGLKAAVYKGTWIAEKVTGVKPGYEIGSAEVKLGAEPVAVFSLKKPENDWPAGLYRLEIRAGNRLVHTERFLIR